MTTIQKHKHPLTTLRTKLNV